MTQDTYQGDSFFVTGDINLAAALMSVGIPLCKGAECEIIADDRGGVYGRFRFDPISQDGKFSTRQCNEIFGGLRSEAHPFQWICDFIGDRPMQKMNAAEWLEYAFDEAKKMGVSLPKFDFKSVEVHIAKNPDAMESYYFAFACNRAVCVEAYKTAKRSHMTTHGSGFAVIDSNMPRHQQRELLGRL